MIPSSSETGNNTSKVTPTKIDVLVVETKVGAGLVQLSESIGILQCLEYPEFSELFELFKLKLKPVAINNQRFWNCS